MRSHFMKFDYILATDTSNLAVLQRMKPEDSTAISE
jgi:protein-tyrosine-phosphatase